MSDSVKIFRDIGLTVFSSIISLLLGFILTVVLGRYLGAEDLGLYRLISVIYSMAMLIFALGIPSALIKSIAEHKEDQNRMNSILSASLVSSMVLGLCCAVFVFISAGALADLFHEQGLTSLLVVLAPVFPFSLVGGGADWIFERHEDDGDLLESDRFAEHSHVAGICGADSLRVRHRWPGDRHRSGGGSQLPVPGSYH